MGSYTALAKLVEVEKVPEDEKIKGRKRFGDQKGKHASSSPKKLSRKKIDQLIIEHREHGRRLAWSFLSSWRVRMNQDEVMSVVGVALCEAANRFDVSKEVSFKTFFFYHLRGMLLKEIAKIIQEQKVLQFVPQSVSTDFSGMDHVFFQKGIFSLVDNNNPERIIQKRQLASLCWEACAQLDPLEQEVLIRYFVYDEPLIGIAKELNYCRCHISRVKSRALAKLGKLLSDPEGKFGGLQAFDALISRNEGRKNVAPVRRGNYTGGRGRRRQRKVSQKSETLNKILAESY